MNYMSVLALAVVLCISGGGRQWLNCIPLIVQAGINLESAGGKELENGEGSQKEGQMKREFCRVVEVNDGYLLLKNTREEFYQLDRSYDQGFAQGERVVLSYRERTEIAEHTFQVVPDSLFRSDNRVITPY